MKDNSSFFNNHSKLNKEADLDDSKSAFFQLGKLFSLDKSDAQCCALALLYFLEFRPEVSSLVVWHGPLRNKELDFVVIVIEERVEAQFWWFYGQRCDFA